MITLDVYDLLGHALWMEPRTKNLSPSLSLSESVSADEWRDFHEGCAAEAAKGGELGAIAGRMLDVGERLRSLSARVDEALKKFPA